MSFRDFGVSPLEVQRDGWTTQQVLKLEFSRAVSSSYYLVLDAKNHFIQEVSIKNFLTPDQKIALPLGDVCQSAAMQYAMRYLRNSYGQVLKKGLIGVTAVVFQTAVARQLVDFLRVKEEQSVCDTFFAHHHLLTEFHLYQAFILSAGQQIERSYEDSPDLNCTLWAPMVRDHAVFNECMAKCEAGEYRMFAVHWLAAQLLTAEQWSRIAKLWLMGGLAANEAQAKNIIQWQKDHLSEGDREYMVTALGRRSAIAE